MLDTNIMTPKKISFVNNNNNNESKFELDKDNNNSVGTISELEDVVTPSIKRGFYGLEDIMVRRQYVPIKTFANKSVQAGNGWTGSHDFAGQTSFDENLMDNDDINLDQYLKIYADESYHSEGASESIIKESKDALNNKEENIDEESDTVPINKQCDDNSKILEITKVKDKSIQVPIENDVDLKELDIESLSS